MHQMLMPFWSKDWDRKVIHNCEKSTQYARFVPSGSFPVDLMPGRGRSHPAWDEIDQ
jgi:hypothetical protein